MRRAFAVVSFLIFAAGAARAAGPEKPRKVSILTKDGQTLAAVYRKPAPGRPVLVMLHGLSSTKEEWAPFSELLAKAGWGTLAYDARAHGASDPSKKGIRALGNPGPGSAWERMVDDLGAALRFLEKQGISRSSVSVCGASLGANVAARYAALSSPLRAVVLLSPGLNYMEFNPEGDVIRIASPTLMVASVEDKYAFQSCLRLKNLAPAHELWTDVPPGHGVQMLTPPFAERLLQWLETSGR
jgi:alpha-beta hydrolase superfamily lysophospholipase